MAYLWHSRIAHRRITAACGPVAFLGLATPHVVRLLTAERSHRVLIPLTALTGAILALAADWGVKGFWGMEQGWPLNAVLSLIGGPMVIWCWFPKRIDCMTEAISHRLEVNRIDIRYGCSHRVAGGGTVDSRWRNSLARRTQWGGQKFVLRAMAGLQALQGGSIVLNGSDVHAMSSAERAQSLALWQVRHRGQASFAWSRCSTWRPSNAERVSRGVGTVW